MLELLNQLDGFDERGDVKVRKEKREIEWQNSYSFIPSVTITLITICNGNVCSIYNMYK